MGNVYTIYCYFNADQIQGILNAVVMLMGSSGVDGDYLSLVRVAALLGSFMAVCYGFLRARGEDAAHYMLMVAIFYTTLFIPRVTVTIEDHGGAGVGAPIVVDNVPIGLAFFASTTSHIGYWLTDKTETFFSLPDTSLRLSSHGLMGGARALRLAQSAAMPDPILAQDVTNFMRECINPELVVSPTLVNSLLVSKDIWTDLGPSGIGVLNPGRMVTLSGNTGSVQCDDAYTNKIGPRLAPAATTEFARIAQILSPNASPATANTMLASLLPASEGLIMTASASTTDAIRQRMMINMLNDTSSNMAQVMNDPTAAQTALGTAMATSNANTAYSVMARLAQETLPLVRNAIELVVLGIFPIVLILIIIAGSKGGMVLRSYVMTMLWVQLWAPLYAIVNYVGMMAGAKNFKASLAGIDGVAVNNAAALLNSTISAEAVTGMLTISVPMIAMAIIKGGEAGLAGITSGMTGPADRASSKVGEQVGSGNVSMGNMSWGNYNANNANANKSNTAMAYTTPNRADIQTEAGSYTARGSFAGTPNAIGNMNAELGNPGVTGSHGSNVQAMKVGQSGDRAELTRGSSTGLNTGTMAQFTQQEGAAAAAKIQKALDKTFGGDNSWTSRDGASNVRSNAQGIGTESRSGHNSEVNLGGNLGVRAGAEVAATPPKPNSPAPAAIQQGTPVQPANVAPGQPGAPAAAPAVAPAGQHGATPAAAPAQGGVSAPAGSQQQLDNLAQNTANKLGNVPTKSSYGPTASYGGGVKDGESQSWTGTQSTSADTQQRVEKNFDKAAKAVESLMAKTTNSGERAAMQSFLGSLARSTNATYSTNVGQSYTQQASNTNQRSDTSGAAVQVNDNARYGAELLRQAGGNASRALTMASDPGVQNRVAGNVGGQIAGENNPRGGPSVGMDGQPIEAPKTVAAQRKEGEGAVAQQRPKDVAAANSAGQGYIREANGHRAPMGAPTTTAMPDQTPAQTMLNNNRGAAERGYTSAQDSQAVNGGLNRTSAAIFNDKAGFGRLLDASFGFGLFGQAKTPEEIRQPLEQLASVDPQSRGRLAQIGKNGRVSEDDMEFLSGRAKQFNIKQ